MKKTKTAKPRGTGTKVKVRVKAKPSLRKDIERVKPKRKIYNVNRV